MKPIGTSSKRLYRPWLLKALCVAYTAMPLGYFVFAYFAQANSGNYILNTAVARLSAAGMALLLSAPIIGLGLFSVTRIGYFAFFLHTGAVFALGIIRFSNPQIASGARIAALAVNALLVLAAIYLLRPSRRFAYLARELRGFRQASR